MSLQLAPIAPDSRVGAILLAVADCLCGQIVADGLPGVCFCGVVPGAAAIYDYAGSCDDACGMAWVRLISIYPAVTVGLPDNTPGNCTKALGMDIEVGIVRCMSAGEPDGSGPDPSELLQSTELQVADAETLIRAVACCPAIPGRDSVLAAYTPVGPDGGLVGGLVTVATMV